MSRDSNQRVMLTKRLLKEALIAILGRKRIEQVSVTELCREAGINRSTFYAHYGIPQDVLTDIKEEFADQLAASIDRVRDEGDPRHCLECVCRYIFEHRALERVILTNSSDDEVVEAALRSSFQVWGTTSPFLRVQDLDDASRSLAVAFYCHGIFRVIREWIRNDIPKTPEEVADVLYRILFGA